MQAWGIPLEILTEFYFFMEMLYFQKGSVS